MKKWYLSKTLWINVLAIIGGIVYNATGTDHLNAEVQISVLGIINGLLRMITKESLTS